MEIPIPTPSPMSSALLPLLLVRPPWLYLILAIPTEIQTERLLRQPGKLMSEMVCHSKGRYLVRVIRLLTHPGKELFVMVIISVCHLLEKPAFVCHCSTHTVTHTHWSCISSLITRVTCFKKIQLVFVTVVIFVVVVSCRKLNFSGHLKIIAYHWSIWGGEWRGGHCEEWKEETIKSSI